MTGLTVSGILLAALWSFGASACCAFYLNTGKYDIIWGGLFGAAGWVIYTVVLSKTGSPAQGYLAGAFAVAACSEIMAVLIHNPATVFLLPGLLPLVPGGGIFYMMRSAVQGNLAESLHQGYETLIAAGAIALGLALASSGARVYSLIRKHVK
jgi:uncharacterized membrane protein YjjB (DUF3815 family)